MSHKPYYRDRLLAALAEIPTPAALWQILQQPAAAGIPSERAQLCLHTLARDGLVTKIHGGAYGNPALSSTAGRLVLAYALPDDEADDEPPIFCPAAHRELAAAAIRRVRGHLSSVELEAVQGLLARAGVSL